MSTTHLSWRILSFIGSVNQKWLAELSDFDPIIFTEKGILCEIPEQAIHFKLQE